MLASPFGNGRNFLRVTSVGTDSRKRYVYTRFVNVVNRGIYRGGVDATRAQFG
jgi:hypothetical protein